MARDPVEDLNSRPKQLRRFTVHVVETHVHPAAVAVVGDDQVAGHVLHSHAAVVVVIALGNLQQIACGLTFAGEGAKVHDPLAKAIEPALPNSFAFNSQCITG